MKKLLIVLVTSVIYLSACLPVAQIRYNAYAGASLASYHQKSSYGSQSSDSKAGVTAGVAADVPISEQLSFQPALNFVQKGGNHKEEDDEDSYESKITLNNLELPLNLLFKPKMNSIQFFAGAGPSIAMVLSGKEKETWDGGSDSYKFKIGNDPDKHDVRRMEFGANFVTGIETKSGLSVALNYNLGLSNIAPGDSDDGSLKNRYWGLRVGYIFNKKSKQ